jgi:hypothetical protein
MASRTQGRSRRSYYDRAGEMVGRARQEATTSRIVAAGVVATGAAAYALLRDPSRREQLKATAQDYINRGTAWWQGQSNAQPAASEITVS